MEILKEIAEGEINLADGLTEAEYHGMKLSQTGYAPAQKRVDAILKIKPPKTVRNVRDSQVITIDNFKLHHQCQDTQNGSQEEYHTLL